ncbi:MAG: hypothetical protein RLZZ347_271 [Candidatus Parcubacteria bacterium]|jgi:hypothetical protein
MLNTLQKINPHASLIYRLSKDVRRCDFAKSAMQDEQTLRQIIL